MWNNNPYGIQNTLGSTSRPSSTASPFNYSPIGSLKGRPVSSIEEAKATAIDFDGSVVFFPDLANRSIYTKQFNPDGTATLNIYKQVELPPPTPSVNMGNYVTKEELNESLTKVKNAIQQDILNQVTAEMQQQMSPDLAF